MKKILFLSIILFSNTLAAQTRYTSEQDSSYPILTHVDTTYLFSWLESLEEKDSITELMNYLTKKPLKNDPIANFILAKLYQNFWHTYGLVENQKKSKLASYKYFKTAAKGNLALANMEMYYIYFFTDGIRAGNERKMFYYLDRVAQYGDNRLKAIAYDKMARNYYDDENKSETNMESTLNYLFEALKYDSTNTGIIDFISSIYYELGKYEDCLEYALKSTNSQSQLKAALMLIEGEKLPMDKEKGLRIVYYEADELLKQYTLSNFGDAMVTYNAIYILNDLLNNNVITTLSDKYKIPKVLSY